MSLVFNMVGGGGGISENRAVLVARVLAGSTVTATKGSVTLAPKMWVVESDPTQDIALFVIAPSLFDSANPWTVTATLGTETASDTIIIDDNKEYDLELSYSFYIYQEGTSGLAEGYSGIDGRYSVSGGGTVFDSTLGIVLKYPNDYWTIGPAVDLSEYSTFYVELEVTTFSGNNPPYIGLSSTTTSDASGTSARANYLAEWHATGTISRQTVAIDISALQVPGYIKACGYSPSVWTIFNMWFS